MNLLALRSVTTSIKLQFLFITILIINVSLLQVIVQKLLNNFIQLNVHLNEKIKTVIKIWSYIVEVKNHIIILKEKLSIIKNYAVRTQSIFVKIINILDFIVEYLRKNDRTVDADVIEIVKDRWIVLNMKNERILMKCKNKK